MSNDKTTPSKKSISTTVISLRVPFSLFEQINKMAEESKDTRNGLICKALHKFAEQNDKN